MSYAYTNNTPFPEQWGQPMYPELTTQNLMLSQKDECDLVESGIFPTNAYATEAHPPIKAEDSEMLNNTGSSSDKSSPSVIFNNLPLTAQDVNMLNGSIQLDPNQGLSEQEIANKRKAQNRAAQRAFRERKEMKLKELEEKLKESESDKASLKKQLDELKEQNVVISTENKLLLQKPSDRNSPLCLDKKEEGQFTFPINDKFHAIVSQSTNQLNNSEIPYSEKRLTIPETWEYLANLDTDIDMQVVMDRLKGQEVCHKTGPAYTLQRIDAIVKEELENC